MVVVMLKILVYYKFFFNSGNISFVCNKKKLSNFNSAPISIDNYYYIDIQSVYSFINILNLLKKLIVKYIFLCIYFLFHKYYLLKDLCNLNYKLFVDITKLPL